MRGREERGRQEETGEEREREESEVKVRTAIGEYRGMQDQ
jgi:hypothetical protein